MTLSENKPDICCSGKIPNHLNRLQYEKSPYLLQHKDNPVDWYPWGKEALDRAKIEDKPILLSIGYSSCHWCHVMEHESFNDKVVAQYMNEHFICIKLDREERPDLDKIYMDAVQSLTGSGGWPLNCFLLPNLKPFYGGTYFPSSPKHERPSWTQILQFIITIYTDRRSDVEDQADSLLTHIRNNSNTLRQVASMKRKEESLEEIRDNIFSRLQSRFDRTHGGFGSAPKFPGTMTLSLLLDIYFYSGNKKALDHALLSLVKMGKAGIYDQVGGGFARYATDKEWNIPHFEKMLYDNAQLISLYSKANKLSTSSFYSKIVFETTAWLNDIMKSPTGGYYSAIDADSEGEEGKYYVWTTAEIRSVLTSEEYNCFINYFDLSDDGNWDDPFHPSDIPKNIVWFKSKDIGEIYNEAIFKSAISKLKRERSKRNPPLIDTKILTAWNSLLVIGWLDAFASFNQKEYLILAKDTLDFIHAELMNLNNLKHQFDSVIPAMLDDIAYTIEADIRFFELLHESKYLDHAISLTEYSLSHFYYTENNSWKYSNGNGDLIAYKDELYDNTMPSASGIMAMNLIKLGRITGNFDWEKKGEYSIDSLQGAILEYPESMSHWASLVLSKVNGWIELKSSEENIDNSFYRIYIPNIIIHTSAKNDPGYSLCHKFTCEMPKPTIQEFRLLLETHYYISD